jgi:hypothetical protein
MTKNFASSIAASETRFADLAQEWLPLQTNQSNHSRVTAALSLLSLAGFITTSLKKLQAFLDKDPSTTDLALLASPLITQSTVEIGNTWEALAEKFLNTAELFMAGKLPQVNTDGLPFFYGQHIDSALVVNRISLENLSDNTLASHFKAMYYAQLSHFLYGILVEDDHSLVQIRKNADVGKVYDRFDALSLDHSFTPDPVVFMTVLFFINEEAANLLKQAKNLAPMLD